MPPPAGLPVVSQDDADAFRDEQTGRELDDWAATVAQNDELDDWATGIAAADADIEQQASTQVAARTAATRAAGRAYDAFSAQPDDDLDAWAGRAAGMGTPRTAAGGTPSPAGGHLTRVYRDALAAGLDEDGARAAVAVAKTEGGYTGAQGDAAIGGSRGTFQLYFGGGMGNAYAKAMGIGEQEADARLAADPHAANAWALGGYLGQAIRQGQAQGLSGPALAEYAQRHGQRSVSPERAAANYGTDGIDAVAVGPEGDRPASEFERAEAPNQFALGLPAEEAYSACGPVAALAFAQANGRNPTLEEARTLARQVGWTAAGGMNGVANQKRLLDAMGVGSRLDTQPDLGQIAADAASGNPVIVSTARHYYFVSDYDPDTGKLHVGQTGLARKGGAEWMTAEEIAALDGGINGALFVDNPQSPTPSVATQDAILSDENAGVPTETALTPFDDREINYARFVQADAELPNGLTVGGSRGDLVDPSQRFLGPTPLSGAGAGFGGLPADSSPPPAAPTRRQLVMDALTGLADALLGTAEEAPAGIGSALGEAGRVVGTAANDAGVGLQGAARSLPGGDFVVDTLQAQGRRNLENQRLMRTPDEELTAEEQQRKQDALVDLAMMSPAIGSTGPAGKAAGEAAGAVAGRLPRPRVMEQLPLPLTLPAREAPNLYDRFAVARMAGMLSGTGTHVWNAAANTVSTLSDLAFKPAQVALDAAAVGASRVLPGVAPLERTRYLAEWGPQAKGYLAGAFTGMRSVPQILARGVDDEMLAKYDARRLASGSRRVDTAVELPLRLLAASDAVFRGGSFGGHAAALATRQATREGLSGGARAVRAEGILANLSDHPKLLEEANALAARSVFQETRPEIQRLTRLREGKGRVLFDVFLPFIKTPYNVAAQGAGMTPAGYAGALRAALNGNRSEAVDRAVRATAGTLGLYVGLNLAGAGYLTGAYPEEASERSTLPQGWKPYSLRVPRGDGAVYLPVATTGAFSVPLGMAANLAEAHRRGVAEGDLMKAAYRAVGATGKYMLDLSALQGISAVTKLITEPERAVEAFTESLAASAVPYSGLMRQVQQALGDSARDPRGPHEAFLAAIPGLSGLVPERLTPLGEPASRGPSGPAAMIAGPRLGVEEDEPTLRVLRAAGVGVPRVGDEYRGLRLSDADRRDVQRRAGSLIRTRLRGVRSADARRDPRSVERLVAEAMDEARAPVLERLRRRQPASARPGTGADRR